MPTDPTHAACICGGTSFEVSAHRLMCIECGAGPEVKEVDLVQLVKEANNELREMVETPDDRVGVAK